MKPSKGNAIWNAHVLTMAAVLLGMTSIANAKPADAGTNDASQVSASVKRDPFWPVGYVPKEVQSQMLKKSSKSSLQIGGNSWREAMKKVVINGVSSRSDSEYYAVINGTIKSVGDTVSVTLGNTTYTWAVDNIKPPGSVKLRRVSVR